jgi:hypothetical protein
MDDWITPEKLHVITNHVPLIGLGVAALGLMIAIPIGRRGALLTTLVLTLLTSASVAIVMESGEAAYDRHESVLETYLDAAGDDWMHIHEERAEFWSKLVYANAALALVAIGLAAWRPRDVGRFAGGLTLIVSLACVASMAWVADAGGKIHHQHFRGDAPVESSYHAHDETHLDTPTPDVPPVPDRQLEPDDAPLDPSPTATTLDAPPNLANPADPADPGEPASDADRDPTP